MSIYLKFPSESDYNYRLAADSRDTNKWPGSIVSWEAYSDAIQHAPTYVEHWDNMSIKNGGYIYAVNVVAGRLYEFSTNIDYDGSLKLYDADGFIIRSTSKSISNASNSLVIGFMAQETERIYVSTYIKYSYLDANSKLTIKEDVNSVGTDGNDSFDSSVNSYTDKGRLIGYWGGKGDDSITMKSTGYETVNAYGGNGNDIISFEIKNGYYDDSEADGGTGIDTLIVGFSSVGQKLTLVGSQYKFLNSVATLDTLSGLASVVNFYGIEYVKFTDKTMSIVDIPGYTVLLNDSDSSDSLRGDNSPNNIQANLGSDQLNGYGGNDTLSAGAGNDFLIGGAGNDFIDGGVDIDTAIYEGARANYVISPSAIGYDISSTIDGYDTLTNIEFLQFSDQLVDFSVVDLIAPTVNNLNPLDEAAGVPIASDIVVTFSEPVAKGTGSIVLKTGADMTVATYDAATSSNLSISGSTLTINPTADLAYSTGYKVEFAAGSIKDLAGNAYVGTTSYNFTTQTGKVLSGGIDNDSLVGSTGNDNIDGGAGIDTAVLSGNRSNHTLTKTVSGWTVSSSSGGTDTVQNVERIKFNDATVALDIDGNGGQAYRVYQAAFNRAPDAGGLGFWINTMDSGASLRSVAEGFTASAEFKALYGTNPTNAQIVTKLYDNVLHRPGETGGFNFWLGVLDSKADTLAGVLAAFSESAENQAGLVGVIGNGFAYTPFG